MLATPWPEPVRETEKVRLVDGVEHLDDGSLDNLVFQRGDPERPLPPIRLRDVHPPRRPCAVRSLAESGVQPTEILVELRSIPLPRDPVCPRGSVLAQCLVRLPKPVDGDVVEKRGELRLPVPYCHFAYPVQRIGRTSPALRPGCVLLARVPLGQAPSLHRLRCRRPGVVRRLHRYYGPVRLPLVVHQRRAAIGLLAAARRTICGGRPEDLPVLVHGDSSHARGLRPRGANQELALAFLAVLPSVSLNHVGAPDCRISRLNTLPVHPPVNASSPPLRVSTHDSGPPWIATPSVSDSCIPFSMPVYPGALSV